MTAAERRRGWLDLVHAGDVARLGAFLSECCGSGGGAHGALRV